MSLDHEKIKKARSGSRSGSGWKPKPGNNRVFILPPGSQFLDNWETLSDLSFHYKMHYFRIAGRQTEAARCLEELRQRCPACETWRIVRKALDPAAAEAVKKIAPADTYLFNLVDLANLQAGVQHWAANYTCWDKIMEIASNPAWGNVCDPANGVCFGVNMTPESQSRTGWNQYNVLPEPQRVEILAALNAHFPDWKAKLDLLPDQATEAKPAEELRTILLEMGFAPIGAAPAPAGSPAVPQAVVVPGVGAPISVGTPSGAPVAMSVGVPSAAPAAVVISPAAPSPAALASFVAMPAALAAPLPHYDPGPDYVPKPSSATRPEGSPRCYGDFNAVIHQCRPCPVQRDCQLKTLGLS
jgi:hypothetical protein